jgi:ribose transport system permease protein
MTAPHDAATDVRSSDAEGTTAAGPRTDARRVVLLVISRYGTLIGLAVMLAVFSATAPGEFPTYSNLINILSQASLTAIIAAGLTYTLVVGEFDLSIGYVASFCGLMIVGLITRNSLPVLLGFVVIIIIGAALGTVNGLLVTKARINAVIATLGVGTILTGAGFSYSEFPIATGIPAGFTEVALGRALFDLPNPILFMAVVLVVLWVVLNKTDLGHKMQAVGGNIEAARLSGIRVDRIKIFAFATAGGCAALTGALLSSLLGSGTLSAADGYLLDAFAAVFLGSATLRDGEFHIFGTLVGVLIIAVGFNGLSIFGAPTYVQPIFKGSVLVLAVGLSTLARRYAKT